MARISLDPRPSLALRAAKWWMRRTFGQVMDPARALGHHPRLLRNYMSYQAKVVRWRELDFAPKALAQMAAVAKIGCPWCVDFGYWICEERGLSSDKVAKVMAWREHTDVFTDVELLAMEYGERMSQTPPTVSDELVADLIERIGEARLVELTATVATENARARINVALGVTSQGFSEACATPPPAHMVADQ